MSIASVGSGQIASNHMFMIRMFYTISSEVLCTTSRDVREDYCSFLLYFVRANWLILA